MGGVADRPQGREHLLEQAFALQQGLALQVVSAGIEEIECVASDRVVHRSPRQHRGAAQRGALLKPGEARDATSVECHDLAVDGEFAVRKPARALRDFGKQRSQVDSPPRTQRHYLAAPLDHQPVAVVLDLEHPAVAVKRLRRSGEHGLVRCRRRGRRRRLEGLDVGGERGLDLLGSVEAVHGEPRQHGVVGERAGARPSVALLDEQPLLAGVIGAFQLDEREPAAQLVAV